MTQLKKKLFNCMQLRSSDMLDPKLIEENFILNMWVAQQFKCAYCCGLISLHGVNIDWKYHGMGLTKDNIILCCRVCISLKDKDYEFSEFRDMRYVQKTKHENIIF